MSKEAQIVISHRLADNRHLLYVDGRVKFVGSEEECERRARLIYHVAQTQRMSDDQLHNVLGY